MDDEILTVREAAEYLKMTPRAIYGRVARRSIPYVKIAHTLRFLRSSLDRWIAENSVEADG